MSTEALPSDGARDPESPRRGKVVSLLNAGLFVLAGTVGIMTYAYLAQGENPEAESPATQLPPGIIQLDVLNGCGVRGAGARIMSRLRSAGFDVVEMKNYRSFDVPRTLVVDRTGNLDRARMVAEALGVPSSGIVQQINPDYFVDVSVIVGADFATLSDARGGGDL